MLRVLIAEMDQQFGREALNSEIERLALFADDDPIKRFTTFLPFLLILVIAFWRSGSWERRVIREELASEVGHFVSEREYQAILADRIMRTRRIDDLRPNRSAALVNAQHELAFRKKRVRDQGQDPEQDRLVAGWRQDIGRLRAIG